MGESFIKVDAIDKEYFLKIQCNESSENYISITAIDGSHVWYGKVSRIELQDQATSAEKNLDEFLKQTKFALSLENPAGEKKFSHSIDPENGYLKFSWKLLLDHGLKFQLGTAKLYKDETKSIGSFLDGAVFQFMKMKEQIATLSAANTNLLDEREKTFKTLKEFAAAKNELEEDLYGKFVAVLNEKKAKIRELKQKCQDLQHGQKQEIMERNAMSSEEDMETEDEEEKKSQIATSQQNKPLQGLVGLEDDDDDDERVALASKRKRGSKQKTRGAASVIPRTVSLPRPLKREKSASSNASDVSLNQSSENVDKLLDNL